MSLTEIGTFSDSLNRITQNPNLTPSQIMGIIKETSVGMADGSTSKVTLLYSGGIDANTQAWEVANTVGDKYPAIRTIPKTHVGELLNNQEFIDALDNSITKYNNSLPPNSTLLTRDKFLDGYTDSGGNKINGAWAEASSKLAADADNVISITPFAKSGGVFAQNEVEAWLKSGKQSGTFDGIPRDKLVGFYNDLKTSGASEAEAIKTVREMIQSRSYNNIQDIDIVRDSTGKIVNVALGEKFIGKIEGITPSQIPDGTTGKSTISEMMPKMGSVDPATLHSLEDGLSNLKKIGIAGDVLAVTIAVFKANEAYAAGDKAGAVHIMETWAAEFVGGIGGGVAGVKAALGIIGFISIASPPGVVISGILVLAGALGGGYYGGELGKFLLEKGIELELYTQQMINEFVSGVRDWWAELSDSIDDLSDSISAAYWKFLDALAASLIDPLIIDTAGNGIKLDSWQTSTVLFDLDGNGTKENTGWTKANGDDAFLVIDKNNDGKINDITEMFGNRDVPGFAELAKYDSNKDKVINSADSQFNLLKLWNDKNANGVVDSGELTTLAANNIKEISLSKYNSTANISGNMQTSISTITKTDGTVRNIHELNFGFESLTPVLATNRDATLPSTFQLNIEAIVLPYSRGYGSLYSWQAAMTLDPTLLNMAKDLAATQPKDFYLLGEKFEAFLFRWAGVENVKKTPFAANDNYLLGKVNYLLTA